MALAFDGMNDAVGEDMHGQGLCKYVNRWPRNSIPNNTVLKPTQVGWWKSTKVLNENFLRNSAKSPCKFARKGTMAVNSAIVTENRGVRLFNKNTSLCQVERRSIRADACHVLVTGPRMYLHPTEGRANGRSNLDCAKVAKSLVH